MPSEQRRMLSETAFRSGPQCGTALSAGALRSVIKSAPSGRDQSSSKRGRNGRREVSAVDSDERQRDEASRRGSRVRLGT
jgi:hypothetical protein